MSDLISREEVVKEIRKCKIESDMPTYWYRGMETAQEIIEALPSADRPTGEWIVNISDYKSVCSVCGAKETDFIYGTEMWYGLGESKYCPNCGAKMEGAER